MVGGITLIESPAPPPPHCFLQWLVKLSYFNCATVREHPDHRNSCTHRDIHGHTFSDNQTNTRVLTHCTIFIFQTQMWCEHSLSVLWWLAVHIGLQLLWRDLLWGYYQSPIGSQTGHSTVQHTNNHITFWTQPGNYRHESNKDHTVLSCGSVLIEMKAIKGYKYQFPGELWVYIESSTSIKQWLKSGVKYREEKISMNEYVWNSSNSSIFKVQVGCGTSLFTLDITLSRALRVYTRNTLAWGLWVSQYLFCVQNVHCSYWWFVWNLTGLDIWCNLRYWQSAQSFSHRQSWRGPHSNW